MEISKVAPKVRTIVLDILQQKARQGLKGTSILGAEMLYEIFHVQATEASERLRSEIQTSRRDNVSFVTLWPKMIIRSDADDTGEGVVPVWGPITNAKGNILGITVHFKTRSGKPRKPRAQLGWVDPFSPEPD